jgi:hypothetical protein
VDGKKEMIKEKLVKLAKSDEKSVVRMAAIDYLSANYKDSDLYPLYIDCSKDSSYYVLGAALTAIGKSNSAEAIKLAQQFEGEKNTDILQRIAEIYAKDGSDEHNEFFIQNRNKFSGYELIGFISEYGAFLRNSKKDETVNRGLDELVSIAKSEKANQWNVYYAKKSIKEIEMMYDEKISIYTDRIKNLKAANPNAPIYAQEEELERAKLQKEKVAGILRSLN